MAPMSSFEGGVSSQIVEASQAVYRFKSSFQCSGTFVSNDGYFITALHCIKGLNYEYLRLSTGDILLRYQDQEGVILDQPLFDLEATKPKLVFLGDGHQFNFSYLDNRKLSDLDRGKVHQIVEDFAILKFDLNNSVPCVQIATPPPYDADLFGMGYPFSMENTEDNTLFLSLGKRVESYSYKSQKGYFDPNTGMKYVMEEIDNTGLYSKGKFGHAHMKAAAGMSGGGVFDLDGRLIGIFESSVGEYTNFILADFILNKLRASPIADKEKKIFSCKN